MITVYIYVPSLSIMVTVEVAVLKVNPTSNRLLAAESWHWNDSKSSMTLSSTISTVNEALLDPEGKNRVDAAVSKSSSAMNKNKLMRNFI